MATKYKHLKSAVHNYGHPFLGDMNAVGVASEYVIVPHRRFRTAAAERIPWVRIDFMRQQIDPEAACNPERIESIQMDARWLPRLFESQSIAADAVQEAALTLDSILFVHADRALIRARHPGVPLHRGAA
jgi:hypothetical protein